MATFISFCLLNQVMATFIKLLSFIASAAVITFIKLYTCILIMVTLADQGHKGVWIEGLMNWSWPKKHVLLAQGRSCVRGFWQQGGAEGGVVVTSALRSPEFAVCVFRVYWDYPSNSSSLYPCKCLHNVLEQAALYWIVTCRAGFLPSSRVFQSLGGLVLLLFSGDEQPFAKLWKSVQKGMLLLRC